MERNPYLIPNFHSITEMKASMDSSHHCFGFSSHLDYNGIGFHDQISLKFNKTANYYALRPTLPFFVSKSRIVDNYAAKNCLIYCPKEELLISNTRNQLIGLNIKDKVTDIDESYGNSIDVTQNHFYSFDQPISCGPFRNNTTNICNLFNFENDIKPVIELKLNNYENKSEITANSRNHIRLFRFNEENDDKREIEMFKEIKDESIQCLDLNPIFDNTDRNPWFENEILISFTSGNILCNLDIEADKTIWTSKEHNLINESNKQIGLDWSQWHNRMFFYGEHDVVKFVDIRGRRNAIDIYRKGGHNLFDYEMFYAILPNQLNDSQLYVASDYHIFLTDIRFPNENLIQLNHMLPKTLIRSLKSLVIENSDDSKTELLVSSNFHRNCLMSFKSSPTVQPISLHLPLHLSTPKDIDKMFENYFIRGLQLMPFQDNTGFSIAMLTNSGDIFMQDLYRETYNDGEDTQFNDKTFSGGIGSSNLELDNTTKDYMFSIRQFIRQMNIEKDIGKSDHKTCLNCKDYRVCKLSNNVCNCKDIIVSDDMLDDCMSDKNSIQSINSSVRQMFYRYTGVEIRKMKSKLTDLNQFNQTTNDYTKKIYDLWHEIHNESIE